MTHELNEKSEIISENPGSYLDMESRMDELRRSKSSFIPSSKLRKKKKSVQMMEERAKTQAALKAAKSVAVRNL